MNIEIKKLSPELTDDYISFFDVTPHNQRHQSSKCYCVYWCNDDCEGENLSTKAARRDLAVRYIRNNNIQGYLAYYNGKVVGWCNANTKSDCLKCMGWHGMNGKRKGFIPTEELGSNLKIKSVFCFTIAPEMRRQGIASKLLEHVCRDAANDGFDFVEAYPDRNVTDKTEDFVGYARMYEKSGFTVYYETNRKLVMRKALK